MYATDINVAFSTMPALFLDPVNEHWVKPPTGYLKLNVDGGFKDGRGGYGGFLWDDRGQWIWGFTGSHAALDPVHTELEAIKAGLQLLTTNGHSRTIIETDSSKVVSFIHANS